MEKLLTQLLLGNDLRRLRNTKIVTGSVKDQKGFDELFALIFHHERPLVMRAADAVEKITAKNPEYLVPHKAQLLSVLRSADHKELKWHLAQLLPRVPLTTSEFEDVWNILSYWALNVNESKIVRVNSLQGLFDLARQSPFWKKELDAIINQMKKERIPSIQARIKKLGPKAKMQSR